MGNAGLIPSTVVGPLWVQDLYLRGLGLIGLMTLRCGDSSAEDFGIGGFLGFRLLYAGFLKRLL